MAQTPVTVSLTTGSAAVPCAAGTDLTGLVTPARLVLTGIDQSLPAAKTTLPIQSFTLAGGVWTIHLAANFANSNLASVPAKIHTSFTENGLPLFDTSDTAHKALLNDSADATEAMLGQAIAVNGSVALAVDKGLRNLAITGPTQQIQSTQMHFSDYLSTAAFTEYWANLAAWNAVDVVVSGGVLHANGAGSSSATSALHAFSVPQNGRLRMRWRIDVPAAAPGSNGLAMVGVNTAAAGSAPLAGGANSYGIGILTNDNTCTGFANGTFEPIIVPGGVYNAPLAAGSYYASINADENGVSMYITDAAHTIERVVIFNWTAGPANFPGLPTLGAISNLMVYLGDQRGASGIAIGPGGARAASPTITPRDSIETTTYTLTSAVSPTDGLRIQLPAVMDSRKPAPVVFYFHGAGQDEQAPFAAPVSPAFFQAISAAGFALLSSRGGSTTNWGNQASLDAYLAAYHYYGGHYPLGPICILSESMGGLAGLLTLADRRMPLIVAWAGTIPVCSLASMFNNNAGTFAPDIRTAYGIASDGHDYAAKTAGHDPLLIAQGNPSAFRGLPMRFYASYGDTVVLRSQNTDPFAALMAPVCPEATVVTVTGDHGDPSDFQASDVIAFFQRYLPS